MRPRLSYSNVVATLALFLALGGTSIAAFNLTSRDIKNRSIRGVDVGKNQLGGKEIRESRLGIVNNARTIDGLAPDAFLRADGKATDAERLDGLDSADFLRTGGKAADADTLDGLDSSGFLSAAVLQSVERLSTSTTPLEIFSWPELGARITTDGTSDGDAEIRIENTRPASDPQQVLVAGFVPSGGQGHFISGQQSASRGGGGGATSVLIWGNRDPTRTWLVQCGIFLSQEEIRCMALRSRPD
jgi:hypothetical protein